MDIIKHGVLNDENDVGNLYIWFKEDIHIFPNYDYYTCYKWEYNATSESVRNTDHSDFIYGFAIDTRYVASKLPKIFDSNLSLIPEETKKKAHTASYGYIQLTGNGYPNIVNTLWKYQKLENFPKEFLSALIILGINYN